MGKTKTSSRLKILLATLAAVVAFGMSAAGGINAYADDSGTAVTIGDGDSTQYNIPYCSYYKNGGVETLYTAGEIGMAGSIQSIAYNVVSGGPNQTTSVKFYMGHTTATSLNSTALAPDDGWTLVYSGAPNLGSETGWETITLDEPFEYDGESNLLVLMVRQSNSDTKVNYYCTSADGVVIYKQSDTDSATYADSASFMGSSAYSVVSSRPNTQFVIEEDAGEAAPVIKTTSLPSCNLGEAYSAAIKVKANPAATVTVTGLPAGLAFDAETLTISGTPTEAGTFPVTITATNGIEPDATATLSLAITTEAPAITTESLPNGKVGKAYSATIEATGVPAPTISVSGLPEGLAFDETTNTISGTPAEAGEASVTVTAHNGYGDDAVQTFAFTIKSATASEEIEVEIGTGTTSATQGNGVPFHTYYKNSVTQSIYSADEIAFDGEAVESGTINAISYNVSAPVSGGVAFSSLDIYMGYTNETTPSSTGLAMSERTLVYSATNGTIGSESGWEKIELSTPFEYDSSNGNLVIMVVRSASDYNGSLGYYATAGKTGLYANDNTAKTDPDEAISAISKAVNYRANIKLDMEVGASVPKFSTQPTGFTYKAGGPQNTALTATATSKVSAPTFVWYKSDNGELADAAAIVANATAVTESAEGTAADGAYTSSYTPIASDLTDAGTVYYYCVATDSVGSGASKPAAVQVYTEDAQAPVGNFAISSDPAADNGVVTAGETTTVTFTAAGAEAAAIGDQLYFQWYKKGAGDADFAAIEGATEQTYSATVVVGETAYQCRVHSSHQIPSNVSADVVSNTITINGTALTITNAQELADFRDAVNNGDNFSGRTVLLGADIDISSIEGGWTCIGLSTNAKRFAGTFDGQGHTITIGAIDTSTTGSAVGLFGYVRGEATIKNLTVAGTIESTQYNVAAVANTSYGATFENVRNLANVSTTDTSGRVAGIVASVGAGGSDDPTVFVNCVNKGNISTAGSSGYASGIANLGATSSGCIATFENCYNTGTISGVSTMSGDCYISGIVSVNKSNNNANTITNCYNAGALSGGEYERGYGLATKATLVGANYYLDGAPDGGIGTNNGDGTAVAKTADEMASADFLALLGDAYVAGSALDSAQATPALAWEAPVVEPEVPAELQLSKLEFRSGSGATSALRVLEPEFDPAVKNYTMVVPSNNVSSAGYAWATLADGASGAITIEYPHASSGATQTKTVTSGATSGTSLANSLTSNSVAGNTLTVKVDGQEAYVINVKRMVQINTLKVFNDGTTLALTPTFAMGTNEYSLVLPADAQLDIAPTISNATLAGSATITIAGQEATSGQASQVTPVWSDHAYDLVIKVSAEGAAENTYTIHCSEQASSLVVETPPTKTAYDPGDLFDPAGMTLKATFANGDEKIVGADEFTYDPAGALKLADSSVTVSYGGLTATQAITVNSPFEGSGTEADPFLIKTAADYDTVKDIVDNGDTLAGTYFKQDADITLSSDWTSIGSTTAKCFSGNLDGGNYTVTVPVDCTPLFGFVRHATVSNLNIYGERIAGAGLVDNMKITGDNDPALTLDNVTLKSGSSTLRSGLVDAVPPVNAYGAVSAGFMTTIRNCTVEEGVIVGYSGDLDYIGGFAGRFQGIIEDSTCNATVKGGNYVGGFIGMRANSMGYPVGARNCTFGGSVIATGERVGGIAGAGYVHSTAPNAGSLELVGNNVTGTVTGANKVGGILGANEVAQAWDNLPYVFKDNTFTGTVTATAENADAVGAIAGYYKSLNKTDAISGNTYASTCGAAKGIGKVDYVDTSSTTHETESGAIYFNTAEGKPDGISGVTKLNYNRTDDPLGADAESLCKMIANVDPADQEAVDAVAAQFAGYAFPIRYANGYTNVADAVKATMQGYDAWQEGMTVTLKSYGETEALDPDGTIHYKESAFGYVNVENVQNCVFTVELNGATADTDGRTVQIGWNLDYFKAQMQAEADAFTADLIKEENESLDAVTSDLFLRGSGATNVGSSWSVVEWTSSNPDVIAVQSKEYSNDFVGKVTQPKGDDAAVTLTATFKANDTKLTPNCESQDEIGTITKTFEVTVLAEQQEPLTEEQMLYLLDKYYIPLLAYTDEYGGGTVESGDTINGDLQLPRYTQIKFRDDDASIYVNPQSDTLVFNNREISVTSDNPAIVINGYRGAVDRFNEDGATNLTISFTRDGLTVSRNIALTVDVITESELDAEIALMELAKEHYWDAINDNAYSAPEKVTGNLHAFQEINVDDEGNPVYIYTADELTGTGIIPDGYFEDPWEMEGAGYNRFRSSDPTIVAHENLVVTVPENPTEVTITSWLSSDKYGDLAPLHPDNEKLQQLYKQEVSVTVTVGEETPEPVKTGWVKDDEGNWHYYNEDGTMLANGWAKDSKGWCYLDADGNWVKDKWIKWKDEWYYLKANGYMAANEWAKDSHGWMYMNSSGKITKDKWIKYKNEWYYLKANGYMAANEWAKDSHGWMYMDASGKITKSKWVKYKDYWYYLKADGYMATGTQTINGKTYRFDSSGKWIS